MIATTSTCNSVGLKSSGCWNSGASGSSRRRLVAAAELAARALRQRWPVVQGVWLFGSAQSPEAFRRHSDLDLAVEGLPAEAHLHAIGAVERVVDPALVAAGESGIAIDVVRSEDLPPHWRERALPLP